MWVLRDREITSGNLFDPELARDFFTRNVLEKLRLKRLKNPWTKTTEVVPKKITTASFAWMNVRQHRWLNISRSWTLILECAIEVETNFSQGEFRLKVESNRMMTIREGKQKEAFREKNLAWKSTCSLYWIVDIVRGADGESGKAKDPSKDTEWQSYRYCWTSSLALCSSSSWAKIVLRNK